MVIATRQGGNVVYERFYEPFSEPEKGELREAMHQATAHQPPDSADEALGQYRWGAKEGRDCQSISMLNVDV